MDREALRLLLAQGESTERIARRFRKHPSTISYWLAKYGLVSPYRDKYVAKGGLERERLEELVDAGLSIAQIAAAVERSKPTVRHWLRRYGLRTRRASAKRPSGLMTKAIETGSSTLALKCTRHGETEFILEGRGYYRCKRCRAEQVTRHRRRVKQTLVREAGGQCALCGYDRSLRALEFHHLDPSEKRLLISSQGVTLSLEALRQESRKCVLLCSNCHAEVEDGARVVPLEFSKAFATPNAQKSGVAQSAEQTAVNR
jgi:transposase